MNKRRFPVEVKVEPQPKDLQAGEFSSWLQRTRHTHRHRDVGVEVPCGECTACCRSSLFIHVGPRETHTLAQIPKALLFPAPGLPKGHMLMGYNQRGECPMLIDGRCSIYAHRPQTCRDYDCRIFPATGIELDEDSLASIAERARRWKFTFNGDQARREHAAVRATADYLQEHRKRFPAGVLPANPSQLAAFAVKVYDVLYKLDEESDAHGQSHPRPDTEIVKAILDSLEKFQSGPGS